MFLFPSEEKPRCARRRACGRCGNPAGGGVQVTAGGECLTHRLWVYGRRLPSVSASRGNRQRRVDGTDPLRRGAGAGAKGRPEEGSSRPSVRQAPAQGHEDPARVLRRGLRSRVRQPVLAALHRRATPGALRSPRAHRHATRAGCGPVSGGQVSPPAMPAPPSHRICRRAAARPARNAGRRSAPSLPRSRSRKAGPRAPSAAPRRRSGSRG